MKDHVIVCGFGTKGRTALDALIAKGTPRESVVVIDERQEALAAADSAGVAAVMGSGSESDVLEQAGIARARAVVVAPDRDDTAILMTLTAREMNPDVTLVAAAREAQNVHLLKQSGADSVITSSSAAGRLMGLATTAPRLVEVLEDLLSVGEGLDLVEHEVGPDGRHDHADGDLTLAIVRGDELLRFDDPRIRELQPGDRRLCVRSLRDDWPTQRRLAVRHSSPRWRPRPNSKLDRRPGPAVAPDRGQPRARAGADGAGGVHSASPLRRPSGCAWRAPAQADQKLARTAYRKHVHLSARRGAGAGPRRSGHQRRERGRAGLDPGPDGVLRRRRLRLRPPRPDAAGRAAVPVGRLRVARRRRASRWTGVGASMAETLVKTQLGQRDNRVADQPDAALRGQADGQALLRAG